MNFKTLTMLEIEKHSLHFLSDRKGVVFDNLKEQIDASYINNRSYSSAGGYCDFKFKTSNIETTTVNLLADLQASLYYNNEKYIFDFLLWFENGLISSLEITFNPSFSELLNPDKSIDDFIFTAIQFYYWT